MSEVSDEREVAVYPLPEPFLPRSVPSMEASSLSSGDDLEHSASPAAEGNDAVQSAPDISSPGVDDIVTSLGTLGLEDSKIKPSGKSRLWLSSGNRFRWLITSASITSSRHRVHASPKTRRERNRVSQTYSVRCQCIHTDARRRIYTIHDDSTGIYAKVLRSSVLVHP